MLALACSVTFKHALLFGRYNLTEAQMMEFIHMQHDKLESQTRRLSITFTGNVCDNLSAIS